MISIMFNGSVLKMLRFMVKDITLLREQEIILFGLIGNRLIMIIMV